jgi:hypothetical protein
MLNYADYWTKHHPETHHYNMQKEFLTPHIVLKMLQMQQQNYAVQHERVAMTMALGEGVMILASS